MNIYFNCLSLFIYFLKKASITPLATERSEINLHELSYGKFGFSHFMKNSKTGKAHRTDTLKQPPWRANNSNPKHFIRFNYLDNDEETNNKRYAK